MYCGKMSTCFTEVGEKCLGAKCPLAGIDFYCEILIESFTYQIQAKLIKVNRILNWYFVSSMKKQQLFFVDFGQILVTFLI